MILLLTLPMALAAPVITAVHHEPELCYAGDSFEAWVEVEGGGDLAFDWLASDSLWDLGGSIDVYDEDGIWITCPSCPPAVDGDLFNISVTVSDSQGSDSTSFDVEVSCDAAGADDEIDCSVAPVGGGLWFVALGLLRRRRGRRV